MDIRESLILNPLPDDVQEAIRRVRTRHNTNKAFEVFRLRFIEGRPYDAIAETRHYAIGTCRNYASRIMQEVEAEVENII
jgi:DNA-directed RNA polymerase specialized sigma24 family protein